MTLEIVFDNPNKTYTSGQIVTGKVIRTVSTEQNVKGLNIKFTGVVLVRWEQSRTESSGLGEDRTSRTVTDVYGNEDVVCCYNFFAFGDGMTTITIPPGRYEYPFQFTLPPGLPASFVGSFGKVKYEVKASMKIAGGSDENICNEFLVNTILDLNTETHPAQSADVTKSKTICCCCCASGPLAVVLKTPKIGFVPGECIPIEAEIQNNSSRDVTAVSFTFMQDCTYYAESTKKIETKILVNVTRPGVERGESEARRYILRVPTVPPTGLGNCRIIDVQYRLQMEVKIEGPSKNLSLSTPIIIGTVPVGSLFVDEMPSNPALNASYSPAPIAQPLMSNYDQAPPSYNEVMAGSEVKSLEYDLETDHSN